MRVDYLGLVFVSSTTAQSFIVIEVTDGHVIGADMFGVMFDGTLDKQDSGYKLQLTVTVPPGVEIIQGGGARTEPYQYTISDVLPDDYLSRDFVEVSTSLGQVNARFQVLREIQARH